MRAQHLQAQGWDEETGMGYVNEEGGGRGGGRCDKRGLRQERTDAAREDGS